MAAKYQSVALEAKLEKPAGHPLDKASIVSKLFLSWATPLLTLGNERQLDSSDIWALQDDYRCHTTSTAFEPTFKHTRSILWTIFITYGWRFVFIGVLQVATVACTLYGPIVLRQILSAVETNSFDVSAILKLVVSLFVVKLVAALLSAHSSLENQLISVKITSALQHLLYQKTMHLDSKFRREKTAGEIANMFSNDIQYIINFSINANQLWLVPVQGFTLTRDDDVIVESSPLTHSDNVALISPSLTTPFPVTYESQLFTPVMQLSGHTFDEPVSGRLVQDEERSKGRVSGKVFEGYMRAAGGWGVFASWIVYLAIWQGLTVAGDMWLSQWSGTATVETDAAFLDQSGYNLAVYASLSVGAVAMTVFRTLSIYASGIRASRTMFDQMTSSLLRAPMQFFDTNPLGRVLNRYSNDMNTVDMGLPFGLSGLSATTFITLFSLGTMIYVIQYMGVFLVPLLYAYASIGRYYVQPAREMERVNKTTKSPLLNLISESIEGVLVIRAFGAKQMRRFQRLHYRNVDTNNEAAFASQVLSISPARLCCSLLPWLLS
ncbi:hypothetical protein H310_00781 [Aphanomyces invadans]|uniref:ABC transmembrane type-1 domain-containing protein n=1 Tax=Aphanomyces invadans TaxID=157072 RepID=A0A024UVY2_9STRA|nr:hypothetical protein H310_00781 [Aphanomyces invadans]ETW10489.1 hypothetical protein H310_00781 [Aphanomyces invadans]|eukprot:XP_008861900.1 hypothetical protein H310_00781 [Aphanomyces invadans]